MNNKSNEQPMFVPFPPVAEAPTEQGGDALLLAMENDGLIALSQAQTAQQAKPTNTDDMNDIVLRGIAQLDEQQAGDLLNEMDVMSAAPPIQAIAVEAWQPIETAPKDDVTRVLLLLPSGRIVTGKGMFSVIVGPVKPGGGRDTIGKKFNGYAEEESSAWIPRRPTHWMSMIAAPSQGAKQ